MVAQTVKTACNVGDSGSIYGSVRSPGEGNSNPLPVPAWEIPWTEEPGGIYITWCHKESDTTERLTHNTQEKENKDQQKVIGQKSYDSGQNIHAIVIEMIVYIFSQISDMLISYLKLFKMQSCLRF